MTTDKTESASYKELGSRVWAILRSLDTFTRSYIEAALFASTDESDEQTGGDPMDDNYGPSDIHPDTLSEMVADCKRFQEDNAQYITEDNLLRQASSSGADDMAGYDFWMTRNGHGVGFWETDDWEEVAGEVMDKASKAFGEYNLYVGDDGWIRGCKG